MYFFLFLPSVISFSAKVSINPFLLNNQVPLAELYISLLFTVTDTLHKDVDIISLKISKIQNGENMFLKASNTLQSFLNCLAIFSALSFYFKGTEETNTDFPHPN